MINLLKKPFLYVGESVFLVLRSLVKALVFLLILLGAILRVTLMPRGRNRVRMAVLAVFLAIFFLGTLSYPTYWNNAADWINPKLDAIDMPALDEKIFIKHFWDAPFLLGLDLAGGTRLVYEADGAVLEERGNRGEAMEGLRDVIEQRINIFGVSEPRVYTERSGESHRLVAELAGVQDTNAAIEMIGQTPKLEFKEARPDGERKELLEGAQGIIEGLTDSAIAQRAQLCQNSQFIFVFINQLGNDPCFQETGLSGSLLEEASVGFGGGHAQSPTNEPVVNVRFNDEGRLLLEEITERNIGKPLAIYLDDVPQSIPIVQQKIVGGQAQITGRFTLEEAQGTVQYLNAGALPIPITLISQQTVAATLGEASINASITAGLWGVLLVALFLIFIYRFAGLLSVLALLFYATVLFAIIKLIPITLTLPGIAGLILSLGMAVDANILIFERLREELRQKDIPFAISVDRAFSRAWTSIRDGNISTLLTAIILFFFSTSFVKGFALTLGVGVAVSMFSAMIVTKYLVQWFIGTRMQRPRWLWTR